MTEDPRNQPTIRVREAAGSPGALLTLRAGDEIAGRYRITEVERNHDRSVAGLYLCETPDGQQAMARIHGFARPPDAELLDRVRHAECPHLVRILDVFEFEGNIVEVQELLGGGELSQYCPGTASDASAELPPEPLDATRVEQEVIPALAEALRTIHELKIVHADIKPENILFRTSRTVEARRRGEQVVLADLDLATIVPEHRSARILDPGGTPSFMAPERFIDRENPDADRFRNKPFGKRVGPESDYYALGVTILRLLGVPVLEGLDWGQVADFHGRGERIEVPEDLPARLRNLLHWLLHRDYRKRGGAVQLEQWLAGELPPAPSDDFRATGRASPYRYRIGSEVVECTDARSLAGVLEPDDEHAAHELLERDWIVNWLAELDTELARRVDEVRERLRSRPKLAVLAARQILDPDRALTLSMAPIRKLERWSDLGDAVGTGPWDGVRWRAGERAIESGRLEVWLELAAGGDPKLATMLARLNRSSDDPTRVLERLLYAADLERPYYFQQDQPVRSPAELADAILGESRAWGDGDSELPSSYREGLRQLENGRIAAWLEARGYQRILEDWEVARTDDLSSAARMEHRLRLLDPNLPPLRVFLDLPRERSVWKVPFGATQRFSVPFHVEGRGVPIWTVEVTTAGRPPHGPVLVTPDFERRSGRLTFELDARHVGRIANRTFRVTLDFVATNASVSRSDGATRGPIQWRYRIGYPVVRSLLQLGAYAAAGGTGAALLAALVHARSPELPYPADGPSWNLVLEQLATPDPVYGVEFGVLSVILILTAVFGGLLLSKLGRRERVRRATTSRRGGRRSSEGRPVPWTR